MAHLLVIWGLGAAFKEARAGHGGSFLEHRGAHSSAQAAMRLFPATLPPPSLSEFARSPAAFPTSVVLDLFRAVSVEDLAMARSGRVLLLLLVCRHDLYKMCC